MLLAFIMDLCKRHTTSQNHTTLDVECMDLPRECHELSSALYSSDEASELAPLQQPPIARTFPCRESFRKTTAWKSCRASCSAEHAPHEPAHLDSLPTWKLRIACQIYSLCLLKAESEAKAMHAKFGRSGLLALTHRSCPIGRKVNLWQFPCLRPLSSWSMHASCRGNFCSAWRDACSYLMQLAMIGMVLCCCWACLQGLELLRAEGSGKLLWPLRSLQQRRKAQWRGLV